MTNSNDFAVGGGTFVPLSTTDDQAKQILHDAQVALHSIYGRDKATANKLYDDMRQYGLAGSHPLLGSPPSATKAKNAAAPILNRLWNKGGQDKTDALAISHFFNLPPAQVIKLGGVAPASTNPAAVSQSFVDSAKSAITSANPLAGLFQGNIWLRVAEVGIGILLLAVGIAKLTNAVPAATKVAGAVGKLPIPV